MWELCQNANKGIFNLRHCSSLLIVDSHPFSLSDPTGCLQLLLWSVLDSQRDRATWLIYINHSKNSQKVVEKYQAGDSGKAKLSYLPPCKYSTSQWKTWWHVFSKTWWQNFVSTLKDIKNPHSLYCWHLTWDMVKLSLYSEERSNKLLLCLW